MKQESHTETEIMTLRVPASLKEKLVKEAERNYRNMNQQACFIMNEFFSEKNNKQRRA